MYAPAVATFFILIAPLLVMEMVNGIDGVVNQTDLMKSRVLHLVDNAALSMLVHIHVPKAGGTALAMAISSECYCRENQEPPNCYRCVDVAGAKGSEIPYSISRSSGWRFGAHPPLYFVVSSLESHWHVLRKYNVTPVYLVMLRRPFDRFVSEIDKWGGNKGQSFDWSIAIRYKEDNRTHTKFYPGANSSFLLHNTSADNTVTLGTRLAYYASLSSDLIYHNRYIRMIGAPPQSFHLKFKHNAELGSRWSPSHNHLSVYALLRRAEYVLGSYPNALVLLEERFMESICTLEVLYGHLYRFKWDATTHSHSHSHSDKKFDLQQHVSQLAAVTYPDAYRIWQGKNQADEKLYSKAEELFALQFAAVLDLFKNENKRMSESRQRMRLPHCTAFL